MKWDYLQPVKIYFGKGRVQEIKKIAQELGCARGLLVAGPFFFKSGLAEKIMKECWLLPSGMYLQIRM